MSEKFNIEDPRLDDYAKENDADDENTENEEYLDDFDDYDDYCREQEVLMDQSRYLNWLYK